MARMLQPRRTTTISRITTRRPIPIPPAVQHTITTSRATISKARTATATSGAAMDRHIKWIAHTQNTPQTWTVRVKNLFPSTVLRCFSFSYHLFIVYQNEEWENTLNLNKNIVEFTTVELERCCSPEGLGPTKLSAPSSTLRSCRRVWPSPWSLDSSSSLQAHRFVPSL